MSGWDAFDWAEWLRAAGGFLCGGRLRLGLGVAFD
jgi:hypothetical protein